MLTPQQVTQARAKLGIQTDASTGQTVATTLTGQDLFSSITGQVNQPSGIEKIGTGISNALTGSTQALGKTIGETFSAPKNIKDFTQASKEHSDIELSVVKKISELKQLGQDTSKLEKALKEIQSSRPSMNDFTPVEDITNKQVIGQAIGTGLEALSGGILEGGIKTAATGLTKDAIVSGAKVGGMYGAIGGLSQGLQQNKDSLGIASDVAIGSATGSVLGGATAGLINKTPELLSGAKNLLTKNATKAEQKSIAKTVDILKSTEDTLSKADRISAINEGRVVSNKLGGKDYLPSETEQRAAEILNGKLKSNPVKNVPIIKNEIATLGKDAEQYLSENPKPITNKEHLDMFAAKRADMEKYSTPAELKAYDDTVKLFSKQLPGRGTFDTSNYYLAAKDFEKNVADKLPKGMTALLDPSGVASAKIHAASDVRKVVRDMIGIKNTEFKQKMFDLASLYDVKDTMITKADKLKGNAITRFAKEHPYITGAASATVGLPLLNKAKNAIGL